MNLIRYYYDGSSELQMSKRNNFLLYVINALEEIKQVRESFHLCYFVLY